MKHISESVKRAAISAALKTENPTWALYELYVQKIISSEELFHLGPLA